MCCAVTSFAETPINRMGFQGGVDLTSEAVACVPSLTKELVQQRGASGGGWHVTPRLLERVPFRVQRDRHSLTRI
jgi:hypothetical protein